MESGYGQVFVVYGPKVKIILPDTSVSIQDSGDNFEPTFWEKKEHLYIIE